jgi:ABC-type branched-subunit amino acid transport system ATPase component
VTALLTVESLGVSYRGIVAVQAVDLTVDAGECLAVIGANGAGKSSLLRGIGGLAHTTRGTRIAVDGVDVSRLDAAQRTRRSLGHVLEGRHLFPGLTVRENVELAAALCPEGRVAGLDVVVRTLPEIAELMDRRAETLSGGQQQLVAIGRSLAATPRVLMLDEPTNGLAPRFVDRVVDVLLSLRAAGLALLLVEQRLEVTQRVATSVDVLSHGRIVAHRAADDPELGRVAHAAYLS